MTCCKVMLHSHSVCSACIVYIQSAKGFSAPCSSCVLFITALSNIIILSIKNDENTNSACGFVTFHLHVFTSDLESQTKPASVRDYTCISRTVQGVS